MNPSERKYLISILGPTAVGKTALSLQLAAAFDTEILSCDSRQFFREMAIGTAVPEPEELAMVPHHFIHHKSVSDAYSVGDYEKDALKVLEALFRERDVAVLVGGSGLYADAVVHGFDSFPEIPDSVRKDIQEKYDTLGLAWLQEQVEQHDPTYFQTVDTRNPQRLMRALEVCIGTGRAYSSFRKGQTNVRPFTSIRIGLDLPREELYGRIDQRVDLMLEQGLVEEARSVYPNRDLNALQTVGYRELFAYFDGNGTLEDAVSEIKKNTRRFAKRQLTWFRRDPDIRWFSPTDIHGITAYLKESIK